MDFMNKMITCNKFLIKRSIFQNLWNQDIVYKINLEIGVLIGILLHYCNNVHLDNIDVHLNKVSNSHTYVISLFQNV